jgi:hypothetical protein
MNYKIGMKVELNGETYEIVGTVKRSWILEKGGKQYKATSDMMGKIKNQNENGIGTEKWVAGEILIGRNAMNDRLRHRLIFNKTAKKPGTETECLDWLEAICNDLSPENLHCDGEISRTAAMKKARALRAEWKEVEKIAGRRISENEVECRIITRYRDEYSKKTREGRR